MGSSISELLALLDIIFDDLHEEMALLSLAFKTLSSSSTKQTASLKEITNTISCRSENTIKMVQLSRKVN